MNIMIWTRNVYGKQNIYVAGEEGEAIAKLTGKKTVTLSDIKALKALGHTVEIVADPDMELAL